MKSNWFFLLVALLSSFGGWMAPSSSRSLFIDRGIIAIPFLIMGAIPVLWQSIRAWGWKHSLCVWISLSLFAYTIEILGTKTGFPYGQFEYTHALGPLILGVPFVLPLAWVPLILGVWQLALRINVNRWKKIIYAASLLVVIDLVLDPGAVALHLWRYPGVGEGGLSEEYFFVPWINFCGWLLSGSVGAWLVSRQVSAPSRSLKWWLFPTMTGMAFWTGVALRLGYIPPIFIGGGLLLGLWCILKDDE